MVGLLLSCILSTNTVLHDTLKSPAIIIASKISDKVENIASPVSSIYLKDIERVGINSPKSLSSVIPSLHIPDYGASLTSTIYLRGLGSRMENPVMGLYIDDIPILDKNSYDFDYLDIRSATMLRGPQGTLFGRNAVCGLLALRTLSAKDYEGIMGSIEYGTANTVRGSLSLYKGNNALALSLRRTDGFFKNEYDGRLCDPYNGASLRWKWEKQVDSKLSVSNIFNISASDEGAFCYGRLVGEEVLPTRYNDEGSYRRLTVLEAFKTKYSTEKFLIEGISSVQILADDMKMDQDYTELSIFTLNQKQFNKAATAEIILRPAKKYEHWAPLTGIFAFVKKSDMYAPVHFKRDGIESLILANANKNIPDEIGSLQIPDREFPIYSSFDILTWNAAAYHESEFSFGRWKLTAGLRMDCEGGYMDYRNKADLHYRLAPIMPEAKLHTVGYKGSRNHNYLELLPKLSALYVLPQESGKISFYANISKGYRAGGFNTQIFSDILRNKLMNGIMEELGVYFDKPMQSVGAENSEYKPETVWNYEIGARYISSGGMIVESDIYYMDCINQQLTVFPAGQSTGRMMTNSGRSRSYGADIEAKWNGKHVAINAAYGWNRAVFTEYNDGNNDYSENRIPYSPEHTLYLCAEYKYRTGCRELKFSSNIRGIGPIWWNEANTLRQPFYMTLGGKISMDWGKFSIYARVENITGSEYRTFYFKSIGNEFFQLSKPAILSIGIVFKS